MKVAVAVLFGLCLAAAGQAHATQCRICDKVIDGKYFQVEDRVRTDKVEVCPDCEKLEARCFACSLPIKSGATTLADGRLLCARDVKNAVLDEDEAKAICLATRDELDRLYSRFLAFPHTNVSLSIVDRFTLDSLFKSPGYERRCTSVFGATRSNEVGERRLFHTVSVLSGLSKPRLQAVAAHEFSHTWLNENLPAGRKAALSPDAVEGFCELIAFQLMEDHREEAEKKAIRENPYTHGQLDAYLTAEPLHGFNAVLEWVKAGESATLDPKDPDGVRQVSVKPSNPVTAARPANQTRPTAAPLPVLPDKLTLKNITGPATRRFAIINDRTFAVADKVKIPLKTTNLVVRCLEIRTNSVLVQIEGGGEQELFLPPEP